ncbi:MAG TPA: DUF4304 domain-containing protein [Humisphaera sp.]
MAAANALVEAAWRGGLRPHLRAAGFAGTGRTWSRPFPDVTQWVAVCSSAGGRGRFVVEVALAVPAIDDALGAVGTRVLINKVPATWAFRLPYHADDRSDSWWDAVADAETPVRLSAAWEAAGNPFVDRARDLPSAAAALASVGAHLPACGAAVALGDESTATEQLALALADVRPANPRFAEMIEAWGRTFGLKPDANQP